MRNCLVKHNMRRSLKQPQDPRAPARTSGEEAFFFKTRVDPRVDRVASASMTPRTFPDSCVIRFSKSFGSRFTGEGICQRQVLRIKGGKVGFAVPISSTQPRVAKTTSLLT